MAASSYTTTCRWIGCSSDSVRNDCANDSIIGRHPKCVRIAAAREVAVVGLVHTTAAQGEAHCIAVSGINGSIAIVSKGNARIVYLDAAHAVLRCRSASHGHSDRALACDGVGAGALLGTKLRSFFIVVAVGDRHNQILVLIISARESGVVSDSISSNASRGTNAVRKCATTAVIASPTRTTCMESDETAPLCRCCRKASCKGTSHKSRIIAATCSSGESTTSTSSVHIVGTR